MLSIKRVYDDPASGDGYRILVDRLWPRGISKQSARLNVWLKDVAPSSELRQWFGHQPERFKEFRLRYRSELDNNIAVEELRKIISEHSKVTLLYGARDPECNQARILQEYMQETDF